MYSRNAFEKRLPDYIIRKLKKTSGLCNPESNHAYEKRLPDYIIQKLCNPEYYREAFLEIRKSVEVREEGMEVQEEAAFVL